MFAPIRSSQQNSQLHATAPMTHDEQYVRKNKLTSFSKVSKSSSEFIKSDGFDE